MSSDEISIAYTYAGYIQGPHKDFIATSRRRTEELIPEGYEREWGTPWDNYYDLGVEQALFGTGYLIGNFPSLYDMFGKFMADFDLEVPWGKIFGRIVTREEADRVVAEEMEQFDDDMMQGIMASYQTSMRAINAVVTSSFIIGKSVMERNRLMQLAKLSLEKKADLLLTVGKDFGISLSWAKKVVTGYAEIMQDYYLGKMDLDGGKYDAIEKKYLWPFYVFDFHRANLAGMENAKAFKYMPERERSDVSKGLLVASYVAQGATYGAQIGGGYGALIGGVIGLLIGLAINIF